MRRSRPTKVKADPPYDTSLTMESNTRHTSGKAVYASATDRTKDVFSSDPYEDPTLSELKPTTDTTQDTSQPQLPPNVETLLKAVTNRFEQMLHQSVDKILKKLQVVEDNCAASLEFKRKRIDELFLYRQRVESEFSILKEEDI